ncbi:peptide deformylase [Inconstantimicrobium mannanitabidum]|uniref:Peptide deformylase n=1 Tax=Inconstantimicrobium mannanitabidum TaxID=1604901 RepID=A0ACB5RAN6_9CLOT|nr:peptide deformylase [Clostridium sp. TW13]GKX66255.1 peptide deformylase [Clostridium sp. TW13]
MAIRTIRTIGDELLRKNSRKVDEVTDRIKILIKDMADTMYEAEGIGIAAPQVGVLKRIFVIDINDETGLKVFINPEIIEASGKQEDVEGCLSVPERNAVVERPEKIKVRAMNEKGEEFELEAEGLLARAICHENDHLDGILFVDKAH